MKSFTEWMNEMYGAQAPGDLRQKAANVAHNAMDVVKSKGEVTISYVFPHGDSYNVNIRGGGGVYTMSRNRNGAHTVGLPIEADYGHTVNRLSMDLAKAMENGAQVKDFFVKS